MEEKCPSQDWYDELRKNLNSQKDEGFQRFTEEFSSCKSNEERVKKLYDLPFIHRFMKVQSSKKLKDAEESIKLRNQGNKHFQDKRNQKALDLYNESVIAAPSTGDTSALAVALANRSAVLLHLKKYDLCLADIDKALKNDYPENLRYKLLERRGRCLYSLNQREDAIQAFEDAKADLKLCALNQEKKNNLYNEFDKQKWKCEKLDSPVNSPVNVQVKSNISFHGPIPKLGLSSTDGTLSRCDGIKVSTDVCEGRGLVASKDVSAGDVLIVEKPFSSNVLKSFAKSHCHECCRRVVSSIPCHNCRCVVYCSETCREISWNNHHKYECDVLEPIQNANIGLGHLAVKMVLKAGFKYLSELDDRNAVKNVEVDKEGFYKEQGYPAVYHLVGHTESRSLKDIITKSLEAVYLLKCLEMTDFFGSSIEERAASACKRCVIGGHILRQLQMLPCNAHECSELAVKRNNISDSVTMEIGAAIYPVLSLINHSCDPNVVRHSYGDTIVVRAIRNIPKGGELLDNYGALCALTECKERREKLEKQYFFMCNCLACIDDYPLYLELPTDVPVFKCDKCGGPIFLPLDQRYAHVPCSFCKEPHNLNVRVSALSQADETYRLAVRDVLEDTSGNLNKHIPILENYLQLMDGLLCRPWRDFNDCQEVLKQCYAVNGSHYFV